MIRKSESSRNDNEDFKLLRESELIDRFQFIDNRFNNPNNLVFPFPRSGQNTRKLSEKIVEHSQHINNYNFNKPNKIKLINDLNTDFINPINNLNEPNKKIIDSINYNNDQQRQKQQLYKNKIIDLQNKINQLKIKYGSNLTRQIIIKELNLKNDPKVDEFLQLNLDNVQYDNNIPQRSLTQINNSNESINYSSNEPINYGSNEPINYSSNQSKINSSNEPIYSSILPSSLYNYST
jgi:hypothetical protein